MPAAPLTVTALLTLCTILGASQLAFGEVLAPSSAVVAGIGLVMMTLVAASGILLARGRWATPTGVAIAATWIGTALAAPLGVLSLAVVASGGLALFALLGPWLSRWLRHLPRADGPPPAAVVMLLALVALPAVASLSSPDGVGVAVPALSLWSVGLALALARLAAGSLLAVRILHPMFVVGAAAAIGLPGGLAVVAAGGAATAMAWRRDVGLAVAPAVPRRSDAVAIPPELVPPDVLEAAGLDDTGRPRRTP